jgi:hypothetical protein
MSIAKVFFDYVEAFERVVHDDDWSKLEGFFAPDAVYRTGSGEEYRGRDAIFAHMKESLDTFDRRFDTRSGDLVSDPVVTGNKVTIHWKVVYTKEGLPDLALIGTEVATFVDDVIALLEDTMDEGIAETAQAWIENHGGTIGISA